MIHVHTLSLSARVRPGVVRAERAAPAAGEHAAGVLSYTLCVLRLCTHVYIHVCI